MKIFKHYVFIAIALITMISFTSCQDEDEIVYNLTDCSWEGQLFNDQYGDAIFSTFTFSEDGLGIERQEYIDGAHSTQSFEWDINRYGELVLYYPRERLYIYIYSYYVGQYSFSGIYQIEDGPETRFELKAVW